MWQAQQSAGEPKEYSASVINLASVPYLDNTVGIKQSKKLRNLFKLNSVNQSKAKKTTTEANYWPVTHTTREYL